MNEYENDRRAPCTHTLSTLGISRDMADCLSKSRVAALLKSQLTNKYKKVNIYIICAVLCCAVLCCSVPLVVMHAFFNHAGRTETQNRHFKHPVCAVQCAMLYLQNLVLFPRFSDLAAPHVDLLMLVPFHRVRVGWQVTHFLQLNTYTASILGGQIMEAYLKKNASALPL